MTSTRRQVLWATAIGVLLLLVVLLTVIVTGRGNGLTLDPDSSAPDGTRALTHVLRNHGVTVRVERGSDHFAAAIDATFGATVVVSRTDLLSDQDVELLHSRVGSAGHTLVLLAPSQSQLDVLAPGVQAHPAEGRDQVQPACADPVAQRAGSADAGGQVYEAVTTSELSAIGCYPVAGLPSYVVVLGQGRTILVGQPGVFTNQELAKDGNAALALGTLGAVSDVLWLVPGGPGASGSPDSLSSLLPRWVGWVALELLVVVLICMVWRGRRLGRLVTEPLPVVVRAVETTQGRARMYRRARARARVAATLQEATIGRLRDRAGLSRSAAPAEVVAVVAARTGIPGADLTAMLLGPPPDDDAGLVRLAQILDQLDREVRRP